MTDASAAAPKADPETLVLRGIPARVTQFRRGMIILLAGVGATGIGAATWLALRPVSFNLVTPEDDRPVESTRPNSDALAGAPAGYDDVPQLGPPLPGDLGRPILNQSRQLGLDGGEPMSNPVDAARQQQEEEARAARKSPIIMQLAGAAGGGSIAGPNPQLAEQPGSSAVDTASSSVDVNPNRLAAPASPYVLSAGSVIAASLITGLNSDLPGLVTAQVTENVYDSVTGRTLLIPQGARLIGRYDNRVTFGQSRALVIWNRLILPDGSSIRLEDAPASDVEGYAGLRGSVDAHGWQLLKGVALSTVLGVGSEFTVGDDESELARAIRESAQQSGTRAGDQLVMRQLDVRPTLRVRPGWPVRVLVHMDMVLRPWPATGGIHD
jgi:type IV secretion system protein TrbI